MTIGKNITGEPVAKKIISKTCHEVMEVIYNISEGGSWDVIHHTGVNTLSKDLEELMFKGQSLWLPKGYDEGSFFAKTENLTLLYKAILDQAIIVIGETSDKYPQIAEMRVGRFTGSLGRHHIGIVASERPEVSLGREMMKVAKEMVVDLFSGWKVDETTKGQLYKPVPVPDTGKKQSVVLLAFGMAKEEALEAVYDKDGKRLVANANALRALMICDGLNPDELITQSERSNSI